MKAKIRHGSHLLFITGWHLKNNGDVADTMIINFADKSTYKSFRQVRNHLLIDTTGGEIDIVFTGAVRNLKIDHYEKDQLVLNCV
jgi:hypothetical protein